MLISNSTDILPDILLQFWRKMAQEGEEVDSKKKSLSSQLRHIRDVCHEGIIR